MSYYENHKEKAKERAIKWNREHPEYVLKYHKEYYKLNKTIILKQIKSTHQKHKFLVIYHYSKGRLECVCCGENIYEFLTLDHINNGGTRDRLKNGAGNTLYSYLIKNDYPEGFQILCYNCNCGRGIMTDKVCPHKKV